MKLPFDPKTTPLSRADLQAAETRLGWQLPASYAELLQRDQNGGWLGGVDLEGHDNIGLSSIYGLGTSTDLDLEFRNSQLQGRLPEAIVAIADASGGNLLCLWTRSDDWGSIWFWDHELEAESRASAAVSKVYENFQSLLDAVVVPDL